MKRTLIALWLSLAAAMAWADAYVDFFRAVNVDDARTVSSLLVRGFDPNAPDERGQVALFVALRGESVKVAAALLAHPDIRVDAANAAGETPLMMAALRGQMELALKLLDRGAQINREGWTPLHYAASGPESRMLSLLLERGAKVDSLSPSRSTALMLAARYGSEGSVDLLLARGADARLRDDRNRTAADFARLDGRDSLAARLDKLLR